MTLYLLRWDGRRHAEMVLADGRRVTTLPPGVVLLIDGQAPER